MGLGAEESMTATIRTSYGLSACDLWFYAFSDRELIARSHIFRIQQLVENRIAHDRLHVLAGLSEWNGFHKLFHVGKVSVLAPVIHAVFAGVVGGQGVFHLAVIVVHHVP